MHELALATAIRDTAIRHAQGRPVSTVRVRVGAMRQVVPDSLDFHFGAITQGSACEGAGLELELVAAQLRCEACGRSWEPDLTSFRCPHCRSAEVEAIAGDELEIESIDVETETAHA